jgi:hypothetical protein
MRHAIYILALILAACGGSQAPDASDTKACSIPSTQADIKSMCGAIIALSPGETAQVEYIITSEGRSATISMNGRDIASAAGGNFSLTADIDEAGMGGSQIAEVTLAAKSGGRLIGVTRIIRRWK